MTHTFKIKETAKSRSLIEHLQTLTYVEHVEAPERKVLSEAEMIAVDIYFSLGKDLRHAAV